MWTTLLFLGFIGVTVLQILIWLLFPARWAFARQNAPRHRTTPFPAISVIICARNEAPRLEANLPAILQQEYPGNMEILVVDDDSSDNSAALLTRLAQQHPRLRILTIHPKLHPGKKKALEHGIRAAQYPWLVFTDADCHPASNQWLKTMLQHVEKPGIVLGYAPMLDTNDGLNNWARFETLYTAMQYFATAHAGWPFMGVGRNMVVHRNLFDAAGGFNKHLHITGGDDDLFVNSVADRNNTRYCTDPASYMFSAAKTSLNGWFSQKRRHISAGLGYKTWHNMVLGGVAFTHAVHYGLAAILLGIAPSYRIWIVASLLVRWAVVLPVYARAAAHLHERQQAIRTLVHDGLLAIWLGAVAPLFLLLGRKSNW